MSKSNPANYRRISLLSIISKVMQSVVDSAIKRHLLTNNLLTDSQFGFRQDHSAPDLITALVQTWTKEQNSRGERLCSIEDSTPGDGTYSRHGYIFASLAGYVVKKNDNGMVPVISVVRDTEPQLLPEVGVVVTCKVTSINPRFAKVHILYVRSTPLKGAFRGTIRREDIRATEKDKVEVYKCFRPGDIVLSKVISLGDAQSNYLLTTAENELGVVVAHSEAGAQMVPVSWCEMQCPKTHGKEFRKVARVQPEFLHA
ncbi:exosome complex component CSL4 isoform X1 [Heptranchias perlo]|uniref:exosome complex component CSL4 isoform X1 n=1 Tax=Heptranchias perlo TaxID=212740 RepID=UPI003559DC27